MKSGLTAGPFGRCMVRIAAEWLKNPSEIPYPVTSAAKSNHGKIGQHNPTVFAMNGYLIYEIA